MAKFCVNCTHFKKEGALCTRDATYDLVYGSLVGGDTYSAIDERYSSSENISKIYSVVSNHKGPCGSEAVYFKEK